MNHIKEYSCRYFLLLMLTINATSIAQAQPTLNYFQVDGRYNYRTELLQLALSYSDQVPLLIARPDIPVARGMDLMAKGDIAGIISGATNRTREAQLHAIKIPILAGILGMRVFLIHRDDQTAFSKIKKINDLQSFVAGFGEHWADIKILRENKLPVEAVAKYSSLFDMLNAKRFDYFPRGINEIYGEYETHKGKLTHIAIEQELAIYYPYPTYFFVRKQDVTLAEIIYSGLNKALADGKFKALFLRHHRELLAKLSFDQRIIFTLKNDSLPEDAEVKNRHWWFDESRIE
ncbi:MAG: hypothetical protein V7765_20655 [Oleispira sp.]